MTNLDNNHGADYMDAIADRLADMEEAMRETDQSDWSLTEIDGKFVGFSVTNSSEEQWEGYDDQA